MYVYCMAGVGMIQFTGIGHAEYMTFVYPCIAIIIVNDDQQDATILAYLFIPNQLYMFRVMSSPIIRSTWLYLQLLILSTDIAAGWCHGWDGTADGRGVRSCASAVVMLDTPCSEVVWRVLATNTIRQFPLHFPTIASPCAITFQLDSTSAFSVTHWGPKRTDCLQNKWAGFM